MSTDRRAQGASDPVFHLLSPDRAKRVAKALSAAAEVRGLPGLGYRKCLEIVARMYGHRGYQDLVADCGRHAPSPDDAAAGPVVAAARRSQHEKTLINAGLAASIAFELVAAVLPTGRIAPRKEPAFVELPEDVRTAFPELRGGLMALRKFERATVRVRRAAGEIPLRLDVQAPFCEAYCLTYPENTVEGIAELAICHERGLTLRDLRTAMLYEMETCAFVEDRSRFGWWTGATPATFKKLDAMIGFVRRLRGDAEPLDPDDHAAAVAALECGSIFEDVCSMVLDSVGEAKEFVDALAGDMSLLAGEGASPLDAAISIARVSLVGAMSAEDMLPGDLFSELLRKPALASVDPDVADAAIDVAMTTALTRGTPKAFSGNGFPQVRKDVGYPRPDGTVVYIADALVAAQAAGFGALDLAACGVEMAWRLVPAGARKVGEDSVLMDRWIEALRGLREDVPSRADLPYDLHVAAFVCMCPVWGQGPQRFVESVEALRSARGAVSLTDVAAAIAMRRTKDIMDSGLMFFEGSLSTDAKRSKSSAIGFGSNGPSG